MTLALEHARGTVRQPAAAPARRPSDTTRNESVSVRKSLQLLDAFANGSGPANLSELARRVMLPKSTTFRLLGQLVESGFVTRTGNTYQLSMHAFELGCHALQQQTAALREVAAPYLGSLFQNAAFIVNLAVLDGPDVVWIDKIQGLRAPRAPSRVGGRMTAAVTALGKAMLAFSPREVVRSAVGENQIIPTARAALAPGLLVNQLNTTRRTRIAFDHEDSALGLTCVAAPVLCDDSPVAAISISGPTGRYQPENLAPLVLRTAERIARALAERARSTGAAWSPAMA